MKYEHNYGTDGDKDSNDGITCLKYEHSCGTDGDKDDYDGISCLKYGHFMWCLF